MAHVKLTIENIKGKIIPVLKDYPVRTAILFGSYAKGDATDTSDVDLLVDTNGDLKGLDFVGLLEILVNALEKDVDLIDKTHIEQDSVFLKEILSKGIVIYDESENN